MNAMRNKVQLIGNLSNLPEIIDSGNGKKQVAFSIGTTEKFKNAKGEMIAETQWHKIRVWGKLAEIAEKYLLKGTEVAIEGKLVNSQCADSKGEARYVTEVHANELLILTKKG